MKYITLAVPCYNSQDYVKRCVESLLPGGTDVEILLINDGSTDNTAEILDQYEKQYPQIVRAIHKKNGGHGSGVNKGLEEATGLYYKVVDSDDWLDPDAYRTLLQTIKLHVSRHEASKAEPLADLYICNYVYNHLDEGKARTMAYRNVFPKENFCTWNDIKRFHASQYLIMHALTYRTELLRKSGMVLPEHTFYVDNIFAYQPLPLVDQIYYLDVDLYQYYLGREDQSVNEKVMMKRIDQQIRITKIIINCADIDKVKAKYPKLGSYMYRFVSMMIVVSSVHLFMIGDKESRAKQKALWAYVKKCNRKLNYRLSFSTLSAGTRLPGVAGDKLFLLGYRAAKKIYKFQ